MGVTAISMAVFMASAHGQVLSKRNSQEITPREILAKREVAPVAVAPSAVVPAAPAAPVVVAPASMKSGYRVISAEEARDRIAKARALMPIEESNKPPVKEVRPKPVVKVAPKEVVKPASKPVSKVESNPKVVEKPKIALKPVSVNKAPEVKLKTSPPPSVPVKAKKEPSPAPVAEKPKFIEPVFVPNEKPAKGLSNAFIADLRKTQQVEKIEEVKAPKIPVKVEDSIKTPAEPPQEVLPPIHAERDVIEAVSPVQVALEVVVVEKAIEKKLISGRPIASVVAASQKPKQIQLGAVEVSPPRPEQLKPIVAPDFELNEVFPELVEPKVVVKEVVAKEVVRAVEFIDEVDRQAVTIALLSQVWRDTVAVIMGWRDIVVEWLSGIEQKRVLMLEELRQAEEDQVKLSPIDHLDVDQVIVDGSVSVIESKDESVSIEVAQEELAIMQPEPVLNKPFASLKKSGDFVLRKSAGGWHKAPLDVAMREELDLRIGPSKKAKGRADDVALAGKKLPPPPPMVLNGEELRKGNVQVSSYKASVNAGRFASGELVLETPAAVERLPQWKGQVIEDVSVMVKQDSIVSEILSLIDLWGYKYLVISANLKNEIGACDTDRVFWIKGNNLKEMLEDLLADFAFLATIHEKDKTVVLSKWGSNEACDIG
jgi:hypothetical protein